MTMTTRARRPKAPPTTTTDPKPPPPPKPPSPPTGTVPPNVNRSPPTGTPLKKIPAKPPKNNPANTTPARSDVETVPKGDLKPAENQTPSPMKPGGRIPWTEMAPPTTPNTNVSSEVDEEQTLQSQFQWSIDPEELSFVQTEDLNIRFLTGKIPKGLGFSEICTQWLNVLNIHTWQDIISFSPYLDVPTVMKELTVATYHKHCSDIRKLLCFGKLCDEMHPHTPSIRKKKRWMPKYKNILSATLRYFPSQEKKYADYLLNPQYMEDNHNPNLPTPGIPSAARKSTSEPPANVNATGSTDHADGGD